MRLSDFQPDFKKIAALAGQLAEELTSSVDQAHAKRILSSALGWLKPYHLAIGFRVRKLSRARVEALVPSNTHNLRSNQEFHESVVISVAQEICQLLIARWELPVTYELDQIRFDRLQKMKGDLTLRLEWEEISREALRAELHQKDWAHQEWSVYAFDQDEKRVADIHLNFKIHMARQIQGKKKGSHGDHSKRN